jgi:hypothetical protein
MIGTILAWMRYIGPVEHIWRIACAMIAHDGAPTRNDRHTEQLFGVMLSGCIGPHHCRRCVCGGPYETGYPEGASAPSGGLFFCLLNKNNLRYISS